MKILNLYACLGGNRYKWDEVTDVEVTAVELDLECARLYQDRFPNDKVVIADAHQYLIENYKSFDFIWSSPPCPSHSRAAFGSRKSTKSAHKPIYPDMKLYQEIIFLKHYFDGKYIVENVVPYYEPLIYGNKRGRHIYWTNFNLPNVLTNREARISSGTQEVKKLCEFHDYDFYKYKGKQRVDKIARNLVDYEAGKTILETALGILRKQNENQLEMF
jgi:DNA (cytosine-5)-methyltransferase 1